MFGLGPTELLLILALVMIIFGAGKLPQVFSAMGKGVKEFRDASEVPAPGTTVATVVKQETTTTTPTTPTV